MIAHNRARAICLVASIVGGIGSVVTLISSGKNNAAIPLLVAMFVAWVSFPFFVLAWANVVSARWVAGMRSTLYALTLVITFSTLAIYIWRLLRPPATTGAFVFTIVPPVTCVVFAVVMIIAARAARRRA
jgi:hypothetical protein